MKQKPLLVYFLFWLVTLLLYFKTAGAGFVTDEVGWLQQYQKLGWKGMFNAFDDKSLHYVYHLVGFLLWKILGLNGTAWMLVFISLHAGVAYMSYHIFRQLFAVEEIRYAETIALGGGLLFLVSPYQTEVLVWYACIHYLVCALLLLLAFNSMLRYIANRQMKNILMFYLCFFIALFTLEISFALPIILLVFFLLWPAKILAGINRFTLIKIYCAPSFGLLVLYFVLSKLLRGSAVGHYGAAEHLNFSVALLIGNLSKYVSKVFFFTQFVSYEHRQTLYAFFEHKDFAYGLFATLLVVLLFFVYFFKKLGIKIQIFALLLGFFIIALLPILNLFFSYIVNVEGDRFTYFASIFSAQLVTYILFVGFRKAGWILLGGYLVLSVKFLLVNTESWNNNGHIQKALLQSFSWQNAEKIYLINLPDNYRGTYMYRSFAPDNSFAETLALQGQTDIETKTESILFYNMNLLSDSVIVEKISDKQYKITLAQWGNWWWAGGKGAQNFSTNDYKVEIDEWGHSYLLTFNNAPLNAVILYQCGAHWRKVK